MSSCFCYSFLGWMVCNNYIFRVLRGNFSTPVSDYGILEWGGSCVNGKEKHWFKRLPSMTMNTNKPEAWRSFVSFLAKGILFSSRSTFVSFDFCCSNVYSQPHFLVADHLFFMACYCCLSCFLVISQRKW